jgi:hypothetical protein
LFKEVPTDVLARALEPIGGTLLALQRRPIDGELDGFRLRLERPLHDLTSANDDLDEMLALLSLLDEYVAVSNTNIHLAAALGRRAGVLVPHPPEWRWMWSGAQSPWFPRFSVYRETPHAGWADAEYSLRADMVSGQTRG